MNDSNRMELCVIARTSFFRELHIKVLARNAGTPHSESRCPALNRAASRRDRVEPRASPAYFNHQTDTCSTRDTSDFCRAISLVTFETSTVAHPACRIISKRDDVTEASTVPERRRSSGEPASGRNATVSLSHCYLCRTNYSRRAGCTVPRRSRAAY